MSSDYRRSSKSKASSGSKLSKLKQQAKQMETMRSEVLLPIFNKVQFIKREMASRPQTQNLIIHQEYSRPDRTYNTIELKVDRSAQIVKERKKYESENQSKEMMTSPKRRQIATSMNWREQNRCKSKSLVNFLKNNKEVPIRMRKQSAQGIKQSNLSIIQKQVENVEMFQPVGRLYQESLRSQTQSLSSMRPESSIHLSKIGISGQKESPTKNYLRKGTRVRQILIRQLLSPLQHSSGSSSLTYLKQYDQWVPTALVQEKKAQLQCFMNIIYGDKKSKGEGVVDLNQIQLVYL